MPIPFRPARRTLALLLPLMLAACGPGVTVQPARLEAATGPAPVLVLARPAEIFLSTGYRRTLPAGGRWVRTGRITQGETWRADGSVLTIEGRQVHEAWLVLDADRRVVGFYLPGESNFSPLSPAVPLTFEEKR